MSPISAILISYRKALIVEGRATRTEYWWFYGFGTVLLFVLAAKLPFVQSPMAFGLICSIWAMLVIVPGISVGARRLHDTDRSAWWLLLVLAPLGPIILLMWFMQPSSETSRFDQDGSAPVKKDSRPANADPFAKLHDMARAPVAAKP